MALNTLKCNHLTALCFKGLTGLQHCTHKPVTFIHVIKIIVRRKATISFRGREKARSGVNFDRISPLQNFFLHENATFWCILTRSGTKFKYITRALYTGVNIDGRLREIFQTLTGYLLMLRLAMCLAVIFNK